MITNPLLIFSTFLFFVSSCGQKSTENNSAIDTSQYAILKFETTDTWLFKNAKPDTLTQSEIQEIEIILKKCIEAYNPGLQLHFDSISKVHPEYNLKVGDFVIDLSKYKRQYYPVINSLGQKEVWVNCFVMTLAWTGGMKC